MASKAITLLWAVPLAVWASQAAATDRLLTPRDVIERAVEVHGGETWLEPGTLVLSGHATFFDPEAGGVRFTADDYRMWRVLDPDRDSAHGADGKVRITAKAGERVIFEVGYDGETSWNERGLVPKAEADAFWASNFGFGIIRSALKDGFTLHFAPTRDIDGRATSMIRILDPQGQATLFGFDRESGFITYLAFDTPRGFHERLYGDFVKLESGWVQARSVTLLYDGIMSNRVFWQETKVGEAVDPAIFAPQPGMRAVETAE